VPLAYLLCIWVARSWTRLGSLLGSLWKGGWRWQKGSLIMDKDAWEYVAILNKLWCPRCSYCSGRVWSWLWYHIWNKAAW